METLINDLAENILDYYTDFVVFLPKLIVAILVFMILLFIANRARNITQRSLVARMDDPLLAQFIGRVVKTIIVIIALLVFLQIVGLGRAATGLLTTAGFGAFILGFAFKDIGENFLAGIMLAFHRPFRIGDTVELDGITGSVVALNLRNSQIKTFDGKDVYIPNANIIKNPVVNYTIDGFLRYDFTIGIEYGSDVNAAILVVLNTLNDVKGILDANKKPAISTNLGESALELTAYYWLDTFDKSVSSSQVKTEAINKTLNHLWTAGFVTPGNIVEVKQSK